MKTTNTVKFGIMDMKTGELLTYHVSSNADSYACVPDEYSLSTNDDNVWLVNDLDVAQKAIDVNTPWYNADYETPSHDIKVSSKTHKVAKVEITQVITVLEG